MILFFDMNDTYIFRLLFILFKSVFVLQEVFAPYMGHRWLTIISRSSEQWFLGQIKAHQVFVKKRAAICNNNLTE